VGNQTNTTRKASQKQLAPVDPLIEMLSKHTGPGVMLSLDEVLRLGIPHILYVMDKYLADNKVNTDGKFVVMRIKTLEKEIKNLLSFPEFRENVGYVRLFSKDVYIDEYNTVYVDLKKLSENQFLVFVEEGKWYPQPLISTYANEPYGLFYANFRFPSNARPVKIHYKITLNNALLFVLGLVAYTMGQAVFYSKPYLNVLVWGMHRLGCDPTRQRIESDYSPYQVIRVPISCDWPGYYRHILYMGSRRDYEVDLANSMLMLNSR
jgi:hypothetical protein